jgi:hypothetical protein
MDSKHSGEILRPDRLKMWLQQDGAVPHRTNNLSDLTISLGKKIKKKLPGGESNPGLPRDRRGYWPLYYRGLMIFSVFLSIYTDFYTFLMLHLISFDFLNQNILTTH